MGLNRITRIVRTARTVTKVIALDVLHTAIAGTHLFVTECAKAIGTPDDEELSQSDWDGPPDASIELEIEREVKGWLTTPSAGPKPPSDAEMHVGRTDAQIVCWDCGGTFYAVSDPMFTRLVTYENEAEYGHIVVTCPGCGARTITFDQDDLQTALDEGVQISLEGKKAPDRVRKLYAKIKGRNATEDDVFDAQIEIKRKAIDRRNSQKLIADITQHLRDAAQEK